MGGGDEKLIFKFVWPEFNIPMTMASIGPLVATVTVNKSDYQIIIMFQFCYIKVAVQSGTKTCLLVIIVCKFSHKEKAVAERAGCLSSFT